MAGNSIIKSVILVSVQFSCLFFLLYSGPVFKFNDYTLILELIALLLVLWAIYTMRKSKMNIFPDVRKGSKLIRKGPYRIIRHPMYLAVILFSLSLILMSYTFIRLVTFLILVIDLLFKIEHEENLLDADLNGYQEYSIKTYKLIPFLY